MKYTLQIKPAGWIKTILRLGMVAMVLSLIMPSGFTVEASGAPDATQETYTGKPICLPDAYLVEPKDCHPLGPSVTLTGYARKGISFPFKPLPAGSPDPKLTEVPLLFAKLNVEARLPVPLFLSLDAAVRGENPISHIQPGELRYISYINRSDVNGKPYVQRPTGEWVRASPASYSRFQGLVFSRTPPNSFGWIIDQNRPRSAPGYRSPEVGNRLYRETKVQIYDVVEADKTRWYMIGLGQWVERRYIRQVSINATPPKGVENGRWIEVNLFEQTLSVYNNNNLVYAALIATGVEPWYTRPGLFKIYKKKPTETMTGAFAADRSDYYYLENVPWTMYFDEARAIHGAYWRAMYGYPQSHGCVNVSIGDARWLYDWAREGDWVYVWDPSGATPTDPKFYTAGGA